MLVVKPEEWRQRPLFPTTLWDIFITSQNNATLVWKEIDILLRNRSPSLVKQLNIFILTSIYHLNTTSQGRGRLQTSLPFLI